MAARSPVGMILSMSTRPSRGKALARPMGAVAIRVPERLSIESVPHLSPRLFVHEGARQSLERRLTAALPRPVAVSITDNRHAIITHSDDRGVLRARIHHMFLDAPPRVLSALVRYVTDGDRKSSELIGHFIEANSQRLAKRSRNLKLVTQGKQHDLLAIFQQLNDKYFEGRMHALVTWGPRGARPGHKRKAIKLGSYSPQERVIRIHPALDRRWVPRYFVAHVMFHEMLHHDMPQTTRGPGRRTLHPVEFLEREASFRFHERAIAWQKAHLARLLRS